MQRHKAVLASLGLLSVAALAAALWLPDRENARSRTATDFALQPPAMPAGLPLPTRRPVEAGQQADAEHVFTQQDSELLDGLRLRFAPHIHIQHAQVKLLEQLISYLQQQYPQRWQALAAAFIRALFPDLADELINKFDALLGFNAWLETHRDRLRSLSPAEREAALWAARYAAFGEDAEEIWAVALKNRGIRQALVSLDEAQGLSMNEKLSIYLDSIESAYGEQAGDFIHSRQTELTNRFLAVDSVQDQLHAIPAEQRNATLREVREAMGMPPEAIERWSALDVRRDAGWANGQAYMQARAQIMQAYQDEEQQAELQRLQGEHFGEQAQTIRAEEQAGFYRYAHKRRIGRE